MELAELRNKEKTLRSYMKKTIYLLLITCWSTALSSATTLADSSLPISFKTENSQGVSYLSGGVGEEERAVLQQLGYLYNLKLVFAEKEGNYLSDVAVTIRDQSGNSIIDTVVDGPWFFALLPPGQYYIDASRHGVTHQQRIRVVTEQQRQVAFYW